MTRQSSLARWYARHGRHDLPWRATRDRWPILVSEVMLHQTQAPRVAAAWHDFIGRFPDPPTTAAAGPAAVIAAWGRLGYPRRARWLWEAATRITEHGWPTDLMTLPGVGRYTAAAIAAQANDTDDIGIEVNIRRVCERVRGTRLNDRDAQIAAREISSPLGGRDRLLALMDVGATVCSARTPRCDACPLFDQCSSRGVHDDETRHRQSRFEGSFRQRRGLVLAQLRTAPAPAGDLDGEALFSLIADGLAEVERGVARLATA
ncbi:MAG: adenine glycosylase [Actinomycetia bacterium]|nr:adenine glycosylase [Actinomycetes bacterium]